MRSIVAVDFCFCFLLSFSFFICAFVILLLYYYSFNGRLFIRWFCFCCWCVYGDWKLPFALYIYINAIFLCDKMSPFPRRHTRQFNGNRQFHSVDTNMVMKFKFIRRIIHAGPLPMYELFFFILIFSNSFNINAVYLMLNELPSSWKKSCRMRWIHHQNQSVLNGGPFIIGLANELFI